MEMTITCEAEDAFAPGDDCNADDQQDDDDDHNDTDNWAWTHGLWNTRE